LYLLSHLSLNFPQKSVKVLFGSPSLVKLEGLVFAGSLESLSPLSPAVKNNQGEADFSISCPYKIPLSSTIFLIIADLLSSFFMIVSMKS
jgi:hypothetical protein